MQHRPGKDKARMWRTLYGNDGRMSREEAYGMVDNVSPGDIFWRIKISPDPKTEDIHHDLSLQEVTERIMNMLQEQFGKPVSWVAAIHADHTPLRHVHALATLPKLSKEQFRALPHLLIQEATDACHEQRQELDRVRDHRQQEREREEEQWEV